MPKKVLCWKCHGEGRLACTLPPCARVARGIPQDKSCDVCGGKGWVLKGKTQEA